MSAANRNQEGHEVYLLKINLTRDLFLHFSYISLYLIVDSFSDKHSYMTEKEYIYLNIICFCFANNSCFTRNPQIIQFKTTAL